MKSDTCTAPGCERPAHARGLCKSVHYSRWCRDRQNDAQKQSYKLSTKENFLRFPLLRVGECREWTRSRDDKGYGRVGGYREGTKFAHRVAMEIHLGRDLTEGEDVLHHCDNPPCCRIEHLYVGDQPQNVEDARVRDRVKFGSGHWNHRLTEDDVREIRRRYAAKESTQVAMAKEYDVHKNTIYEAIHKGWVRVK